jgi:hypothetical protein
MASFERTQDRTRTEIADYLRSFADELDPETGSETVGNDGTQTLDDGSRDDSLLGDDSTAGTDTRDDAAGVGDKVTVIAGNESATINPPQTCTFDVAIDTDSDLLDTGAERSTTFTIRWDGEQVEADDELRVE